MVFRMRLANMLSLGLVLISFIVGVYYYPFMPERMTTHWNINGDGDGSSSKFVGLFLVPFIFLSFTVILIVIPRLDPLKENITLFRKYYDGLIIVFSVFIFSIFVQVILWNLGFRISPNHVFPLGIGYLLFYLGVLMEHAKRNWFIGIRTPWTMSSENVWNKTHKVGGKLFKISGLMTFVAVIFPRFILIIVIFIIVGAAYTVVYSYLEYRKEIIKAK